MKRNKNSPRAKIINTDQSRAQASGGAPEFGRNKPGNEWSGVSNEWRKSAPNSIHSMNDDNEGNTQIINNLPIFQHQKSFGRGSKGGTTIYLQLVHGAGNDHEPMQVEPSNQGWGVTNTPGNLHAATSWDPQPAGQSNDWGTSNDNQNEGYSPARSNRSDERGRGRGRGFGRGRGAPGGGECFKCGQSGHMARECPNPDTRPQGGRGRGGPGGGSRACFKCNEEGHMARDCPNQDQRGDDGGRGRGRGRGRGGDDRACFKCQQTGHQARDCTNQDDGDRQPYKRYRREDGLQLILYSSQTR